MTSYHLTIPGKPQTWQRSGGKGRRYKPAKMRRYQKRVVDYAFAKGIRKPIEGPVRLTADLYYTDRRRRDLDNGVKTIADALEGLAYDDDSQIVELIARKHLAADKARAVVTIEAAEKE